MKVKVGDYIEGYEIMGNYGEPEYGIPNDLIRVKVGIIVTKILHSACRDIYIGKAQDIYSGYREAQIYSENVTQIGRDADEREWKPGDRVRHFKGNIYVIVGVGKNTETGESVVIYKNLEKTDEIWVRPLEIFNSLVDSVKYPDVKQKYRFEKVRIKDK